MPVIHESTSVNNKPSLVAMTCSVQALAASGVAFAINNFWIWLLVHRLGLSPFAPVPLMMAATPCLSFVLNRYWVFRAD